MKGMRVMFVILLLPHRSVTSLRLKTTNPVLVKPNARQALLNSRNHVVLSKENTVPLRFSSPCSSFLHGVSSVHNDFIDIALILLKTTFIAMVCVFVAFKLIKSVSPELACSTVFVVKTILFHIGRISALPTSMLISTSMYLYVLILIAVPGAIARMLVHSDKTALVRFLQEEIQCAVKPLIFLASMQDQYTHMSSMTKFVLNNLISPVLEELIFRYLLFQLWTFLTKWRKSMLSLSRARWWAMISSALHAGSRIHRKLPRTQLESGLHSMDRDMTQIIGAIAHFICIFTLGFNVFTRMQLQGGLAASIGAHMACNVLFGCPTYIYGRILLNTLWHVWYITMRKRDEQTYQLKSEKNLDYVVANRSSGHRCGRKT